MNTLLLGNGFDLLHGFPTKYSNFLHAVNFLLNHSDDSFETVGAVLGNPELMEIDNDFCRAFSLYGDTYNSIPLEQEKVQEMVALAKECMWFSYLMQSFDQDVGWIDFEREIGFVINKFQAFFQTNRTWYLLGDNFSDKAAHHMLCAFPGVIAEAPQPNGFDLPDLTTRISSEFQIERPKGSDNYEVDTEKIVNYLWTDAQKLSKILDIYLQLFIDNPLTTLIQSGELILHSSVPAAVHVVTFNYTHTFEAFGKEGNVHHIHGEAGKQIILGVNPDKNDDLGSVDTTFVYFKKYYQRNWYNTDLSYFKLLDTLKQLPPTYKKDNKLYVIGHSLDVTDKDIISELFEQFGQIIILYHSEYAKGSYIRNLVQIYGKDGFEALRKMKHLQFLPIA